MSAIGSKLGAERLFVVIFLIAFVFIPLLAVGQTVRTSKPVNHSDTLQSSLLKEVVVHSSRFQESLLEASATISFLDSGLLHRSGKLYGSDAMEHTPGIHLITPSLGFRVINARGFSNTTNVRFSQLADGMDIQSPHIGAPVGNALAPVDLDLSAIEVVSSVASSLYGMNTVNGFADFISKSADEDHGLRVMQKTGMNHLRDAGIGPKLFQETSFRYARRLGRSFHFKWNFAYASGTDWIADDRKDLNSMANQSLGLIGADNPGSDRTNIYGDESSNRRVLNLSGKSYTISRTGYSERDLTAYTLRNLRSDLTVLWKPSARFQVSYTVKGALLDNVYQRSNRFRLQDYAMNSQALVLKSNVVTAKLYSNSENSGNSYNLRSMAENIDRSFKSDGEWYQQFAKVFSERLVQGSPVTVAILEARRKSDSGRFVPGTERFNQELYRLQQINNWDRGAALNVNARLVHGEVQWNPIKTLLAKRSFGLQLGADWRSYVIGSDGNYFVNPAAGQATRPIWYSRYGTFISLAKSFLGQRLRLGFVYRLDKNDYFNVKASPRFTLVYTPRPSISFRAGLQQGFRFPSVFEAFSNINSGGVRRVGGLPVMSSGIFENAFLTSSINRFQSAVINDVNLSGLTNAAAVIKNGSLLIKNPYTYVQPERVRSGEIGFRGTFLDRRLFVSTDCSVSLYNKFIAQTNMNVPQTSLTDSIPFYLSTRAGQKPYRVWTNSRTRVTTMFMSAQAKWQSAKTGTFYANTTFSRLLQSEQEDGLEDGFNTPQWMVNLGWSRESILRRVGYGLNLHGQTSFYWQSFLVSDRLPAYLTADAYVSVVLLPDQLDLRFSANNLTNQYYRSFPGGPAIGGFYLLTLTWGSL